MGIRKIKTFFTCMLVFSFIIFVTQLFGFAEGFRETSLLNDSEDAKKESLSKETPPKSVSTTVRKTTSVEEATNKLPILDFDASTPSRRSEIANAESVNSTTDASTRISEITTVEAVNTTTAPQIDAQPKTSGAVLGITPMAIKIDKNGKKVQPKKTTSGGIEFTNKSVIYKKVSLDTIPSTEDNNQVTETFWDKILLTVLTFIKSWM